MIDQLQEAFLLPFQMAATVIAFAAGCVVVFVIASAVLTLPDWLRDWRRRR